MNTPGTTPFQSFQNLFQTNETVNKKVKKALAIGLKPIVCVGEMLEDREAGNTEKVVDDHITNGLAGLSADDMKKIIVAYEPVWAIGTGKTDNPKKRCFCCRNVNTKAPHYFFNFIIAKSTVFKHRYIIL